MCLTYRQFNAGIEIKRIKKAGVFMPGTRLPMNMFQELTSARNNMATAPTCHGVMRLLLKRDFLTHIDPL